MIYFLLVVLLLCAYNYFEISNFIVNNIVLRSKKITSQIKIVQISDFHSNRFVKIIKLIQSIKKQRPDLIVLTGDIISKNTTDFDIVKEFINELNKVKKPILFVHGNHEIYNPKVDEFVEFLISKNVTVLTDKKIKLEIANNLIEICGMNFGEYSKLDFEKMYFSDNSYKIMLAHYLEDYLELSSENRFFDLILSGHTHGGQVRLPYVGSIVGPDKKLFPKYDKGIYEISENETAYVDSGLGNSTLPIRAFNRIQYSSIRITSDK